VTFLYSLEPFSITDLCVYFTVDMDNELRDTILKEAKKGKVNCNTVLKI